jgi:hypothetical protein
MKLGPTTPTPHLQMQCNHWGLFFFFLFSFNLDLKWGYFIEHVLGEHAARAHGLRTTITKHE